MEGSKIKILESFKDGLEKRFSLEFFKEGWVDNKVVYYVNETPCSLCVYYKEYDGCGECPFKEMETPLGVEGCVVFLWKILGGKDIKKFRIRQDMLYFSGSKKKLKEFLDRIKKYAKEKIEFVKEVI